MKAAFIIYTLLLALEGALAWAATGEPFLLAVCATSLLAYTGIYRHAGRAAGEGLRLSTAVLLVTAGPWYYQNSMTPMLLCFTAMPHLLGATQALWERRHGGEYTAPDSVRMRSLVFTIAFYASLGLVFLLLRGMEPTLTRFQSTTLAVAVLLAALPAWDRAQVLRLKPATDPPAGRSLQPGRSRGNARRLAVLAGVMVVLAGLFTGPLPPLAELLTRLSPKWRMNPVEFKNRPPKTPAGPSQAPQAQAKTPVTRSGTNTSASTGEHRLPQQSDIQGTQDIRLFIKPADPAQVPVLLRSGQLYIRSHTLDLFSEGIWRQSVTGGVWREDAADGATDGVVTLQPPGPDAVPHTVFVVDADGYTLPAIQGLTAAGLPRLYEIPGDILQIPASGNIRYDAVSSPRIFELLPDPARLETGTPQNRAHLDAGHDVFADRIALLGKTIFAGQTRLNDRVDTLRKHFRENFTYSTVIRNPRDLGAMENFLFSERTGYCDFFASAATLLLRTAGVPCRVAYGFSVKKFDSAAGVFIVRDENAHAWTEVFIEGEGWTVCDFTPEENAGNLPVKEPSADPAAALPEPEPEADKTASAFDPAQFKDPSEEMKPAAPPPPPVLAATSWFRDLMATLRQTDKISSVLKWMLLILPALAAVMLVIHLLSKDRATARQAAKAARERELRERQPAYFTELLRVCAAAGHPKPDGSTPREYFQSLQRAGLPVPPLQPLLTYHCRVRYEDFPQDAEREKTFFQQIKSLEESLRRKAQP